MNATKDLELLVDELAGHWTEPALEILKAAGIQRISVEMELEAWRTLRKVVQSELRRQPALWFSNPESLSAVKERVLRKATWLVADKFAPQLGSYAFESRIRRPAVNIETVAAI